MEWYKNLNISKKLYLTSAVILIFLVLLGIKGVQNTYQMGAIVQESLTNDIPALDALIQADRDLYQLMTAERTLFLVEQDSSEFIELLKVHAENMKQAHERMNRYFELALDDGGKTLAAYLKLEEQWQFQSNRVISLLKENTDGAKAEAKAISMGGGAQRFESMRDFLDTQQNILAEKNAQQQISSEGLQQQLLLMILVLLGAGSLLGIGLTYLNLKFIIVPIGMIISSLEKMAEGRGDLTQRLSIQSQDELGILARVFDQYVEQMQGTIQGIKDSVVELASSSEEMSITMTEVNNATDDIDRGIEQQSSAISESTHTMVEMASATQNLAEKAQDIRTFALETAKDSEQGSHSISGMHDSMNKIEEGSNKIEGIINVITEIARQTNLLSLNAAIEAAKAGKYGAGFSVVAEKIRELANRSGSSVVEIQKLIDINIENVKEGQAVIKDTANLLEQIVVGVEKMSDNMEDISKSVTELDRGVQGIAQVSESIETVSESNAAATTELAATIKEIAITSEDLNKIADRINDQVGDFET